MSAPPAASNAPTPDELRALLADTRSFFRRFIVVNEVQADAVALWVAHTYVYETARATPYLHFHSPESGSGKTTALEVLEVVAREGKTADDLTGPSMFRLIDSLKPTLLFDEVDAVFHGKRNSETAADLHKVLNSGYRKGKRIYRMGGRGMNMLQEFDPYCPKALAGLHELPGTLAHRSIPVAMQPPLPTEVYEDFDPEEIEDEAAGLRERWQAWAAGADAALCDPSLKPARVPDLDARRNELWRILFRIADLAGGHWPQAARVAATELCGADGDPGRASTGLLLLADIRQVFTGKRMAAADLVHGLNQLEDSQWGGWNEGAGMTTRELGWKLKPYKIAAKSIRIGGGNPNPNGYERGQFEDAFARYLAAPVEETSTTGTPAQPSRETADEEPAQGHRVPLSHETAKRHGQRVGAVVPVLKPEVGDGERRDGWAAELGDFDF